MVRAKRSFHSRSLEMSEYFNLADFNTDLVGNNLADFNTDLLGNTAIVKNFVGLIKQEYITYRKIPKISPGAYIFQRPFLRSLFLEGLIFGGAYLRREICVSKSIGLYLKLEVIYHFCFVLLCI